MIGLVRVEPASCVRLTLPSYVHRTNTALLRSDDVVLIPSSLRDLGPVERGTAESGTTESGTTESGTAESATGESGTAESATSESATSESGTGDSGIAESGIGEDDNTRPQMSTS